MKIHKAKEKTPPFNERVIRFIVKNEEIREIWFCTLYFNNKPVWENGDILNPDDYWSSGIIKD
jgi:hypothetical protein